MKYGRRVTRPGGHPPVCAWYWQAAPVHCWGQRHLYWFSPSRHVPPFWQGLLEHSLISAKEKKRKSRHISLHFILGSKPQGGRARRAALVPRRTSQPFILPSSDTGCFRRCGAAPLQRFATRRGAVVALMPLPPISAAELQVRLPLSFPAFLEDENPPPRPAAGAAAPTGCWLPGARGQPPYLPVWRTPTIPRV